MNVYQRKIRTAYLPISILASALLLFSLPELVLANTYDGQTDTILYQVKPGDTLNRSAQLFDKSPDEIARLNGMTDSNAIQPGQTLLIEGAIEELDGLSSHLSREDFIHTVGNHAQDIADEYNLYASVMIAQAALESNYGNSTLASPPFHNLFGIKGRFNGESVVSATSEYIDDEWIYPNERFRKYPSYAESFVNNAHLLRNGNTWDSSYYSGAWVENTSSYLDTTDWLEERYATDPTYATKLNRIIDQHDLTRFDSDKSPSLSVESVSTRQSAQPVNAKGAYTVRLNDTLYSIANRHNMSVTELKQVNQLQSTYIQENQVLKVKETTPPTQSNWGGSYTVEQNDTLYSIAAKHQMTVIELQKANALQSTHIQVGQTLYVNKLNSPSEGSHATHTVKMNETLYSIANQYGITVEALMQINNLSSPAIQADQVLKIRVTTHTVKPGDTLYNIANRYDTSVEALKEKNQLTSDQINLGDVLDI